MLIIFDWDGTLCDSTGRIVAAMQQAAHDLGVPVPEVDAVENVIGLGLPEAMAALFPALDIVDRDRLRERYGGCYASLDRQPAGLFPGAMAVMEQLRADGHYLAVATGKSRRGLDRVLAGLGLGDWFDATRCADETASKPDPHMLRELLDECGVEIGDALVVGDSEYDLGMAAAIGMARVGVSYGVHGRDRLERHAPLAIIDTLHQLVDIV